MYANRMSGPALNRKRRRMPTWKHETSARSLDRGATHGVTCPAVALGNLAQRALVAVILLPAVIAILYVFDSATPTWLLITGATLLAMKEYFAMTMPGEENAGARRAALIMGFVACAALYWLSPATLPHKMKYARLAVGGGQTALMFAVLAPALYYLFRFRDMNTVAARFAHTVTGIVYCGLLFTFLAMLKRDFPGANTGAGAYSQTFVAQFRYMGADLILLVLAIAWVADTGAYFAGRFLGKAKLYPAVSPKKTWAGAIGGLAGSFAGAAVIKVLRLDWLTWLDVVLIAIPGGILGQLGDLAESMIKRSVGVKDSGAILPGHGGMLDRVDAVLFIAPYVYVYLQLAPLLH